MIHFYIVLYLIIGLVVYFTLPNRKGLSVSVTIPFIIAWLPVAMFLLFEKEKPEKSQPKE